MPSASSTLNSTLPPRSVVIELKSSAGSHASVIPSRNPPMTASNVAVVRVIQNRIVRSSNTYTNVVTRPPPRSRVPGPTPSSLVDHSSTTTPAPNRSDSPHGDTGSFEPLPDFQEPIGRPSSVELEGVASFQVEQSSVNHSPLASPVASCSPSEPSRFDLSSFEHLPDHQECNSTLAPAAVIVPASAARIASMPSRAESTRFDMSSFEPLPGHQQPSGLGSIHMGLRAITPPRKSHSNSTRLHKSSRLLTKKINENSQTERGRSPCRSSGSGVLSKRTREASFDRQSDSSEASKQSKRSRRSGSMCSNSSLSSLSDVSAHSHPGSSSVDPPFVVQTLIPKPHGEAGRPKRGGYNLQVALEWQSNMYDLILVSSCVKLHTLSVHSIYITHYRRI